MKTAVVYVSTHHGNTKKLVDAIAAENEITLIDAAVVKEAGLEEYGLIGFAAGVAFGKYYPQLLAFMERNLPKGKRVFFMHTAGLLKESFAAAAKTIAEEKGCECLGTYYAKGFDTFGPFGLIGGIAKGHPDGEEIAGAAAFFRRLTEETAAQNGFSVSGKE